MRLPWVAAEIIGVAVTFSIAVLLWRSLRRPERRPDVELYDDVMVLPTGARATRTVQYEALKGAVTRGQAPKDELVLEAGGHTYVYPRDVFEDEDGLDVFFLQLRNRLRRHPRGAQIVAEIRHRENLARRLFRIRPRVTHALLGVIVVAFISQGLLGGLRSPDPVVAVRLGANLFERTLSGEWYRLFTANFLHGGLLHIYLNSIALLSLGGAVERLLGRWTYLTVYLVSAVGGALASAFFAPGPLSMGASTALFGLLGAFGVLHLTRSLPLGYRQTGGWWFFTLGVNAILPLIVPVIDVAAHVGGFVVGAALTYALVRLRSGRPDGWMLRPALALLAVFVVAFVQAGTAAARFSPRDHAEIAEILYNPQLQRIVDDYTAHPSSQKRNLLAAALAESAMMRGTAWIGDVEGNLRATGTARALELDGELNGAATVWVLAHRDGELLALLRVRLGPDAPLPLSLTLDGPIAQLDELAQFAVAMVDGRANESSEGGSELDAWLLPEGLGP